MIHTAEQTEEDSQKRTSRKGGQNKTAMIVLPGQGGQDMTVRTGLQG
jgi:hypothetical protein